MNRIKISIIVCFSLTLAIAAYCYHNAYQWQYKAEYYLQEVDLSLYAHRGLSFDKAPTSLGEKIASADRLFNEKEQMKALAHYQTLLKADPANTELRLRLGIIYLQQEQYQLAQENLEVVYADIDAPFALDGAWFLGILQSKYGHKKNAVKWFEKVVKGRGNYHLEAQELLTNMS